MHVLIEEAHFDTALGRCEQGQCLQLQCIVYTVAMRLVAMWAVAMCLVAVWTMAVCLVAMWAVAMWTVAMCAVAMCAVAMWAVEMCAVTMCPSPSSVRSSRPTLGVAWRRLRAPSNHRKWAKEWLRQAQPASAHSTRAAQPCLSSEIHVG